VVGRHVAISNWHDSVRAACGLPVRQNKTQTTFGALSQRAADRESPIDILKRRYAQGEITKEEFDKMRKDVSS